MEKYVKVRRIGEGSFGKALLVKKKADGKQFVIKEINTSKMGRKEREDSRKEVRVLSQMKHPNIVAYHESFEERGSLYIVMDYCDGGDLYQKINGQKGQLIPEDKVLNWFVQICLGLKHVHDRKILHRDIKTQNIFLTKSGVVKLGDFGISRVLNSTMELARTCIGTPYYLSPEICESRPYNNKSDVWALGCVLYELVTLKHAFEAGNMKNLVLKIVRGSYPRVSTRYGKELRSLIDSCLKHQPRQRPSVNAILRLPFITDRIENFLSETVRAEEFSHTVLHRHSHPGGARGVAISRPAAKVAAQPLSRGVGQQPALAVAGRPLPPQPPAPQHRVLPLKINPPPPVKYNPHQPARPKPEAGDKKKNIFVRPRPRPSNGVGKKPISAALIRKREAELRQKNQEEQIRKQHEVEAKMQHENYTRRQSAARLNQAKQAAALSWRSTLSSSGEVKEKAADNETKLPPRGRENENQRKEEPREPPTALNPEKENRVPLQNHDMKSVQQRALKDREEAVLASERARLVMEFQQRRNEAAANKARGLAQWKGVDYPPRPIPKAPVEPIPVSKDIKSKAEEDYLVRLQAIRQQNYAERKRIQQKLEVYQGQRQTPSAREEAKPPPPRLGPSSQLDPEERKRKIAALKAQADMQAELMRKKLEEKRQQRAAAVAAVISPPRANEKEEVGGKWAEPRKQWGEPVGAMPAIAQQRDATGIIREETISNIVFELPESSGGKTEDAASKGSGPEGSGADVEESKGEPSEARKQWKQAEGAPLVAMLQGKTLQSGTYAVGNGTTNFYGAGETRIVFSKLSSDPSSPPSIPVITSKPDVKPSPSKDEKVAESAASSSVVKSNTENLTESRPRVVMGSQSLLADGKGASQNIATSTAVPAAESNSKDPDPTTAAESNSKDPEPTTAVESNSKDPEPTTAVESNSKDPEPTTAAESNSKDPEPTTAAESNSKDLEPTTAIASNSKDPESKPSIPSQPPVVKKAWDDEGKSMNQENNESAFVAESVPGENEGVAKGGSDELVMVEDIELSGVEQSPLKSGLVPSKNGHPDVFSTPKTRQERTGEDDPVSDTPSEDLESYHTPQADINSSMLSASLRAGTFDISANNLRTCSLPDLNSLVPVSPVVQEPASPWSNKQEDVPSNFQEGSDVSDEEEAEISGNKRKGEPWEVFDDDDDDIKKKREVTATSSEAVFDDRSERKGVASGDIDSNEEEYGSGKNDDGHEEEEEEWSSSEDEDLQRLVQTLQNFVEDAKSPINTEFKFSVPKTSVSPPPIMEEWEDSDEEGEPSALVGRSDVASPPGGDEGEAKVGEQGSSVFNRLETTRTMLEMELGLAPMLQAYQLVQTFYEDGEGNEDGTGDNNARVFPMEKLTAIIEKPQLCKPLIHLVMADSAYQEGTEHGVDETDDPYAEDEATNCEAAALERVALVED